MSYLTSLPRPASLPSDGRIAPVETTVWSIDAELIEYKREEDSDVHLVIHDTEGRTMIAEIPSASCVSSASPVRNAIAAVHVGFDARFTEGSSWHQVDQPVTITGIGFWDFEHGQTGVAPNAIEIHPVLAMTVGGVTFGDTNFKPAVLTSRPPTATPTPTAEPSPTAQTSPSASSAALPPRPTAMPSAASAALGGLIVLAFLGLVGFGVYRFVAHLRR